LSFPSREECSFPAAQATTDFGEVKGLAQKVYGKRFVGGMKSNISRRKTPPLGNGEGFDWMETAERILNSS